MRVFLNSPGFSYDVHSLVKAFCPDEDVTVNTEEPSGGEDITVNVSPADTGDDAVSGAIRISSNGINRDAEFNDLARADIKNLLKRTLYDVLEQITGKSLPWGTMTGIRPVKVPMKLMHEGASDAQIARYMKDVYLCSDEKTALATSIAHREADILDGLCDDGFCLYVGIPFCPTTCLYCSFTSYPIASWHDRTDAYLEAVFSELDHLSKVFENRRCLAVYIGGGTPTTLSPDQLERLIVYISERFDLGGLWELTVEAGRSDSITKEKLDALIGSGVTRISINPQTMNAKTLSLIGRRHSPDDVIRAFELARRTGFSNINMDIILGLPGEDENDVEYTLKRIKELAPDSLTVHSMAIKRAAAMHSFLEENEQYTSRNSPQMMALAARYADEMGLYPYYLYRQKNMAGNFENVGYAAADKAGIYNIVMMEETHDIASAGAGVISKRVYGDGRIERCDTVKDVGLYIERVGEMIDRKKKLFEGE